MTAATTVEKTLADVVSAGAHNGDRVEALLKKVEAEAGVALDAAGIKVAGEAGSRLLPPPGSHSMESFGVQAAFEAEEVAKRIPEIKAAEDGGNIEKVKEALRSRTRPAAVTRSETQAFFDVNLSREKSILESARVKLGDEALESKVEGLMQRIPLKGDLQADARRLAKELVKEDGDKLLKAVNEQICDAVRFKLSGLVDDEATRSLIESELAAVRQAGPEFADVFIGRLRTEPKFQGAIKDTMKKLDGTERTWFINEVLGAITDPKIKALIDKNFDDEGKRRLLTAYDSFVKLYTDARRLKARESLIGWLYEATTFVGNLVRNAAKEARQTLENAIADDPELRKLGVKVHEEVLHYDVQALNKPGGRLAQATDLLGTIPLQVGDRTVHVVRAALEAKGESGIPQGVGQLLKLPKRFAKDSLVRTENGDYTVGKNLFLSVEEALVALGAGKDASRNVAKIVGDKSHAAIVVSPLNQSAGKQAVDALNQAAGAGKPRITYVGHDISRKEMEEIAEGVAPVVGLETRTLAAPTTK